MNAVVMTDLQAPEEERNWQVALDPGVGITVKATDDQGAVFDQVRLRRYGAFIVVEPQSQMPKVPPWLEFLRPAIEMRARQQTLGIEDDLPPVIVHSHYIRLMTEQGYLPKPRGGEVATHGMAEFFGVKAVWSEETDRYAPLEDIGPGYQPG